MKVVLAPNAFKGSLGAVAAAEIMAEGVLNACTGATVVDKPVADGGDGLAEVLCEALGGERITLEVTGPRATPVQATYIYVPSMNAAVVEMAEASGLKLLPESQRDPTLTTTYGTGELIAAALDHDIMHLIVGIGGSATTDGGIGMAQALGARFLDAAGKDVEPVGGALADIRSIDLSGLDPRLSKLFVEIICDVDNPLLGEHGAARVYGPQKGASPAQVEELEDGLANLATVLERDIGKDVRHLPGAGAAGGLGAGLCAFLNGHLRKGVDVVLDLIDLDSALEGADLVLTAEGQMDFQTAYGKAPAGVAERAKAKGVPCIAIAGSVAPPISSLHDIGMNAVFSLCNGPMTLEHAMDHASALLLHATEQAVRAFLAGQK